MFYTAHETTWNCYLNISCLLMQLLSTMLDMVYGSDEKEKVLPLLTSIMHNVTPYLKNHRWGLQFPTLIICYFILTMWSRAQVSRPGFEPHPCWSHQNVGLVDQTAWPRHKKTTTHTTHSGLILYGGNKVNFLRAPCSLPWCPWNAPVEIYNFLIGCPLPRSECLGTLALSKTKHTVLKPVDCNLVYVHHNQKHQFENYSLFFSSPNMPSFRACTALLSSLSGYQYTRRAWKKDAFDLLLDPAFFQVDTVCIHKWVQSLFGHLGSNFFNQEKTQSF